MMAVAILPHIVIIKPNPALTADATSAISVRDGVYAIGVDKDIRVVSAMQNVNHAPDACVGDVGAAL